jgi:hypothetical protein
LQHAPTAEVLKRFLENIYKIMKPGSMFIGLNMDPRATEGAELWEKYGYKAKKEADPLTNGCKIVIISNHDGKEMSIDFHWYSPETYTKMFAEAGFK